MILTDPQLCESGMKIPYFVKETNKYKQREKAYYLTLTDNDLFGGLTKSLLIQEPLLNSKPDRIRL